MASTWKRLWLGSGTRRGKPEVRLALIGLWTIFLAVDVFVVIVGEDHLMTGVLLAIVAGLGIAAQVIPLALQPRQSGASPDR